MIHFTPPPPVHLWGPLQINSHGFFFLVGALAAFFWTRARVRPEYREAVEASLPYMVIGGVLGARLAWVALNPAIFLQPAEIFKVWSGGLVSYGGLIGAVLAWLVFLRFHKLPVVELTEAMAPTALLGWGIGRLGCFLHWSQEWGTVTTVPWAIVVGSDAPRHPVMLYQALMLLAAAPLAAWLGRRFGSAAGWSLLLYGLSRFVGDLFREWDPPWLAQTSRLTALTLALVGLALVLRRARTGGSSAESPTQ